MSKIICHDYYGNVVTSLTQWDTNRVLKIHNWQYDVSPIIQWTNRSETESYEVESILNQDGTVTFEVPNALLQNTETAIVFIGVARNGENGSSDIENATVFKVEFPIQRRTKPSGYVYSDNATVVDIVALKEVLENQIESKIDATRTDLSAEITSALHATLDSVKDGAPKATFETQEDLVGKEPGIYLYHHTLGSTDPMAKYDGYVFYWDGEKLSDPLTLYGGKDSQANIAVTLIKPSTGEQFLEITVTDKDGNENIITTDNLNGKDSEGIKKIIYNGSELAVSDDKTVAFNAQPYIEELDFINDESEIEKLTIGKLYIVTKEMEIDEILYYPGSLVMKTNYGIAGISDSGFVFNGAFSPVWSEIKNGITFQKTPLGYVVNINGKMTELILPTKTSELQNDSNFVSDENYVHTDNNFTTPEKQKLNTLEDYVDTAVESCNTAAEKATEIYDIVETKLNNGEFKGVKGDPGESGIVELKASSDTQYVKNLGNHLYYTVTDIRLRTHNTQNMYLDLPQGTFLLVEKTEGIYGNINLTVTIWGSCTFDNVEYKYGIHQYKYTDLGGAIVNSLVIDTKSIETAIAGLRTNKQDKLTPGAGITITDNGVISSDVGLKIVVLEDGADLSSVSPPQENTIYFKRNTETDESSTDWYEEYIYVNSYWELIGTTKIDLTGYALKSDLPTKTSDLTNDSNFVSDENYIHTDNNFTTAEKQKLGSLANYDDTALKNQIAEKQDKLSAEQLNSINTISNKQDKLSQAQLDSISAVPDKIDKSAVGNGLKFADGILQLDIPVATASTTYGGDA